jgi:hypothetical protein
MTLDIKPASKRDLEHLERSFSPLESPNRPFSLALIQQGDDFILGLITKVGQFYPRTTLDSGRVSPAYPPTSDNKPTVLARIDVDMNREDSRFPCPEADEILVHAERVSDPDIKASMLHRVIYRKLVTIQQGVQEKKLRSASDTCHEALGIARKISIDAFKISALYLITEAFVSLQDLASAQQAAAYIPDPKIREIAKKLIPPPPSTWALLKEAAWNYLPFK